MNRHFSRSAARVSGRLRGAGRVALAVGLGLLASGAARADGGSLPAPSAADYTAAGSSFLSAVSPIVSSLIPFAAAAMAIMFGPKILKKMVSFFAR